MGISNGANADLGEIYFRRLTHRPLFLALSHHRMDHINPARYDTGSISGLLVMQPFREQYGVSMAGDPSKQGDTTARIYLQTADKSLITSILAAGTFFGALAGAPIADALGRR